MSFAATLAAEEHVLLDALVDRIDPAANADPDRLFALCDRHRVGGVVRAALHRANPDATGLRLARDRLDARRDADVAAFLDQMVALRLAQEALQPADLGHLVLKGPALARLYPDETVRHAGDLDVLLDRPNDAPAAIDRLIETGWTPSRAWGAWSANRRRTHLARRKDLSMSHPDTPCPLELHWRATDGAAGGTSPVDARRSMERRAGGLTFRTPCEADELAYLVAHGSHHVWFRLKWLTDVHLATIADAGRVAGTRHGRADGTGRSPRPRSTASLLRWLRRPEGGARPRCPSGFVGRALDASPPGDLARSGAFLPRLRPYAERRLFHVAERLRTPARSPGAD